MRYLHLIQQTIHLSWWLVKRDFETMTKEYMSIYDNRNIPFIVIGEAGLFSDGNFLKEFYLPNLKLFIPVRRKSKVSDLLKQLENVEKPITYRPTIICLLEINPGYLVNIFEGCGIFNFTIIMFLNRPVTSKKSIFSDDTWCKKFNRIMYYKDSIVTSCYPGSDDEDFSSDTVKNKEDSTSSAKIVKLCKKLR